MRYLDGLIQRKFDPNQPRDEIGRWTDGAGGENLGDMLQLVAGADWGTLIADFDPGSGRKCYYQFDTYSVWVWGGIFPCAERVPWSATTHGRLLNDNRRR